MIDSTPHRFVVEERPPRSCNGLIQRSLSDHFRVDCTKLQSFFGTRIEKLDLDLLVLLKTIGVADREFTRKWASTGWAREIRVTVPVYRPDRWSDATRDLCRCLRTITGDRWEFEFVQRRSEEKEAFQADLRGPPSGPTTILPYSGGMDSFLGMAAADASEVTPILVTAGRETTASTTGLWKGRDLTLLGVPIDCRTSDLQQRELTYRTRPFQYFAIAAIAARLAGSSSVSVTENGLGSVGPSLTPIGTEWPYYGMHPKFTGQLLRFLNALWAADAFPPFLHPFLWKTKGEMLSDFLASGGESDAVLETNSCSFPVRRIKALSGPDAPERCGVCGGCFLARLTLAVANVEPPNPNSYYCWSDLNASAVDRSVRHELPLRDGTTAANVEMAHRAVLDLEYAAHLTGEELPARWVHELATRLNEPEKTVSLRTKQLLHQHREEWNAFLQQLTPESWVRNLVGAMR